MRRTLGWCFGWVTRTAVSLAALGATVATAQMPGAPVLQNAWVTPGGVGAINFASGTDGTVIAAAASWSAASGRFGLSGGVGSRHVTSIGSRTVYGVRLAIPFGGQASNLGFAVFAGAGGTSGGTTAGDSTQSKSAVPVGASIGWRRALGATHGLSIYASPSYVFLSGGAKSGGLVRGAAGVDVGLSKSLGLTAGADFGQTRSKVLGGPSGAIFGVGLAYAFGHR
jgi:hypothetical protein